MVRLCYSVPELDRTSKNFLNYSAENFGIECFCDHTLGVSELIRGTRPSEFEEEVPGVGELDEHIIDNIRVVELVNFLEFQYCEHEKNPCLLIVSDFTLLPTGISSREHSYTIQAHNHISYYTTWYRPCVQGNIQALA